jgi:cytochrome c oxidase accessory protein FixG
LNRKSDARGDVTRGSTRGRRDLVATPLDSNNMPSRTEDARARIIPVVRRDPVQEELFARREQIFPREVHGVFARWRVILATATLGVYYLLPWFTWGEGRQAFLIDLPGRKFNLFWWTFWPQDLFYLAATLIIAALALFLFTAIAGRVWCGYACPQTVWTEVFLWIERRIEGSRLKQMRLAAASWTMEKISKKTAKHTAWIVLSLWTGFTFVGYFTPIRDLTASVGNFSFGPWEAFWILFYGFATYGNAGWLREQVCLYMCPYARFQSAMFDRDTLVISYDAKRGEPRAARKHYDDRRALGIGDCVDCTLCVQVCPTGIDIRHGLQHQCIACGACIDACDTVMEKMGYEQGLIRYTTENELAREQPRRIFRPRIAVYALVLGAITVGLLLAVLLRVPFQMDILRDRNALYREMPDGSIENVYTLRIMNMDTLAHTYSLTANGIPNLALILDHPQITVAPGEVIERAVRLQADRDSIQRQSTPVTFTLQAGANPRQRIDEEARFLGPVS